MKIETVEITQVKPYPDNPRKISDKAVDKVALSLKEFGWQQPIVVDEKNVIVAGHTRHRAAEKLGFREVPILRAIGLSDEKIRAYRFMDNRKIIELLKKMHIFSYPSIWPETSCVSAIEAMAAGCEVLTTNLGALYETCSPFGTFVNFDRNFDNLEKKYKKALSTSIENFWSDKTQNKLKLQSDTINSLYSWETRSLEWKKFFDEARELKT